MNNFEKLQSMSVEDLAKWLDENVQFDMAPWTLWFDKKYCSHCESIMCHYEDSTHEFPCAWCELNDGCKYFPERTEAPDCLEIVKMWLESEAE